MIHFSLPIGKKLCSEQYEIVKVLGRGGFGITYLTQKNETNSTTHTAQFFVIKECFLSGLCVRNEDDSVKVVAIEETEFLNYKTRFIQEAALLAKMKAAPHIISVLHYFEENNTAYLVMPYETEETLEKYCQTKPNQQIPENEAIDYAFQLISALKVLHENNITHQDIKPSNILRKADGNLILIDFGTAKEWVLTSRSRTLTANAVISPGYAPPESYNPNALKGTFSDVYGLAATLYRLLTGTIPLDATTRSIEELPAISTFAKISHQIEKAIHKALALKPSQRFQTVFDFEKALNGTSLWVEEGENTETINYQTLKKQADILFQQENYAAALPIYEKLITHFPKEQEARQKILLLNTLLEKAKQKTKIQKIAVLSLLFIVGIVMIGTIFHYWLGRKTKETESVSISSDTLNHVSQADITPPTLPNIAQDTTKTLQRLDSTQIDSSLAKEILYKRNLFLGDSAMKIKNYQAAQQHWLEALAIHPKNKYIKQQISVCEQEIQKELQKEMVKQLPNSSPTKQEDAIKSPEPLPTAATPAPTNSKVHGKISGLKDSEGQLFDYEGEIIANQPNGKGKLTYKNGSICEGMMQNSRLNGSCTCTFSNGDRYIGTVKNDRREGRGIYFYTKLGSRYIGEWLNDRQHGKGVWYYENGDKYEAEFVNGHPKGTIKYSYHTGDIVLGKWENGKFTKL